MPNLALTEISILVVKQRVVCSNEVFQLLLLNAVAAVSETGEIHGRTLLKRTMART
jgi:hypothetical protein